MTGKEKAEQQSTIQVRGLHNKQDFKAACAYLDVEMSEVIQETLWEARCFMENKQRIEMLFSWGGGRNPKDDVADWAEGQHKDWVVAKSFELEAAIRFYLAHLRRTVFQHDDEYEIYSQWATALAEWRVTSTPEGARYVRPGDVSDDNIWATEYRAGLAGSRSQTKAEQEQAIIDNQDPEE